MEKAPFIHRPVDGHRAVFEIDNPDHANAALEVLGHLFADFGHHVVRRENLDSQVGSAFWISYRLLIERQAFSAPIADIRPTNGIWPALRDDACLNHGPDVAI